MKWQRNYSLTYVSYVWVIRTVCLFFCVLCYWLPSFMEPDHGCQSLDKAHALSYKSLTWVPLCVCCSPHTSICLEQHRDDDTPPPNIRTNSGTGARQSLSFH